MKNNILNKKMSRKKNNTILIRILLILFSSLSTVFAQEKLEINTITGTVRDAHTKKPINAAQVSIQDKKTSVVTDEKGQFSIKISGLSDVLIITAYDYNKTEVAVKGRKSLIIELYSDNFNNYFKNIETPLGLIPNSAITSSIKSIDDLSQSTSFTADDALQSTLGGDIRATTRSGIAGVGSALFVRGINSININAQPLFVIDGVIWNNGYDIPTVHTGFYSNPLNYINVSDIESITEIKDGAALYGSKGSNGVILIKTKRSKNQVTKINLNISTGLTDIPGRLPMMGAEDFRTYASDMLGSYSDYLIKSGFSSGAVTSNLSNSDFLKNDPTQKSIYNTYHNNTDWSNEVYQRGVTTNYQINVSGGDDKQMSYLSLGYTNTQGVVKTTDLQRYNFKLNSDLKLTSKLTLGVNIGFSRIERAMLDDGINYYTSPTWLSVIKSPFLSPNTVTLSGEKTTDLASYDGFGVGNPNGLIEYSVNNTTKKDRSNLTIAPVYKISPELSVSTLFDYSMDKVNEGHFTPMYFTIPYYIENRGTSYNDVTSLTMRNTNIYNDTKITYEQTFNKQHHVKALYGWRYTNNYLELDYAEEHNTGANYNTLITGGYSYLNVSGINNYTKSISNYVNLEYDFNKKYLLTATVSLDGSSRFGNNTREGLHLFAQSWGVFPSVHGAWIVSSEDFMKNNELINFMKIHGGYSETGNDGIPDYQSKAYFTSQRFMDKANGLVISNLENNQIQWETTRKWDIGTDINLFNNRLSVSIDYFNGVTSNLLVQALLPDYTGLNYYLNNSGTMSNKGYELSLNIKALNFNKLKWELGCSVGHYENKILELPDGNITTSVYGADVLMTPGMPVGVFYGYRSLGVFATQTDADAANLKILNSDGSTSNFAAGDIHFQDINKDGTIDSKDKQIIGNPNPKFYGTISSNLIFDRFTLNAIFTYSYGNEVYNYYRSLLESGDAFYNQSTALLNRWTADGQITNQPKATYGDPMGNARFSNRWIEDGSYIKLKSVTLSYDLPIKSNYIEGVNLWISANNLLTFTKYLGLDPEFSSGNSVYYQGIDAGLVPQTKNYYIGIKFKL